MKKLDANACCRAGFFLKVNDADACRHGVNRLKRAAAYEQLFTTQTVSEYYMRNRQRRKEHPCLNAFLHR